MRRDLFTEDHEAFRELCRDFVEKEVAPHYHLVQLAAAGEPGHATAT